MHFGFWAPIFETPSTAWQANMDSVLACSLITWSLIWLARFQRQDPTALQDACICVLVELGIICSINAGGLRGDNRQTTVLSAHILIALSGWVTILITKIRRPSPIAEKFDSSCPDSTLTQQAKPLVFPSRTSHSRFFPQKHSFSYSYLLVGIPVGWCGSVNGILSVDTRTYRSMLNIDAADYLDRGPCRHGLRCKLDKFLKQQEVRPEDYPHVYLVTAPRVFGYSFNPASFWYLYSADHALTAMIVEVNNTFDERRIYFLKAKEPSTVNTTATFTSKWEKDFHVSPFNSRDGMYTLLARDPAPSNLTKEPVISNTITLVSPEDQPKLVARIFSTERPIDPASLGTLGGLRLFFRLGWIGFLTFPRILAEARKLYFRKHLRIFYRPEVGKDSIGREPTTTERTLETFFKFYLRQKVENSENALRLIYRPAPGIEPEGRQSFTSKALGNSPTPVVEMQVLSPAFYSRFVHYAHSSEAFDNECFCTETDNRTVHVSRPDILARILARDGSESSKQLADRSSFLESISRIRWKALRVLRCPAARQSYPTAATVKSNQTMTRDIRELPLSPLDIFVIRHCRDAWLYRRQLFRLFFAQRLVFGFEAIVVCLDWLLRFTFMWVGVSWTQQVGGTHDSRLSSALSLSGKAFLVSIIHIWSAGKGF